MTRAVLLLALTISASVAAPVPAPSEKEQIAKLWGKTVAASDKCEFKLNGKLLTIRTAGEPARNSFWGGGPVTMPHVTRTAKGDFEATVKVVSAAAPERTAKYEHGWCATRTGLFISGGGYGVELHLFQRFDMNNGQLAEQLSRWVWIDSWFPGGGAGNRLADSDPAKPVSLRIARKEKVVSVSYSFDDKEWSVPYAHRKYEFPDEVTVGVFLSHTTHQIADATFADFTIEKPAK